MITETSTTPVSSLTTQRFAALAMAHACHLADMAGQLKPGSERMRLIDAKAEYVAEASLAPLENPYGVRDAVREALSLRLASLNARLEVAAQEPATHHRARRLSKVIVHIENLLEVLKHWALQQDESAAAGFLLEARTAAPARPVGYAGAEMRQRAHERSAGGGNGVRAFRAAMLARDRKEAVLAYTSVVTRCDEAATLRTRHSYDAVFGVQGARERMAFARHRYARLLRLAAAHERRLGLA